MSNRSNFRMGFQKRKERFVEEEMDADMREDKEIDYTYLQPRRKWKPSLAKSFNLPPYYSAINN